MAIGQSKQRLDAEAKVTGRARYTDDMGLPGMRHAAYVHSTIAHGMVLSIDASEALALPGVEAVFTADDVPGFLFPTAGHPYSMDPSHGDVADRLLLTKHVRYYGDEVAVVVARDGLTARKAAHLVKVEYEPLPVMTSAETALAPGAPVLQPSVNPDGNLLKQHTLECNGTLDEADVSFSDGAACCVVLASDGYPKKYETGFEIKIPGDIRSQVYVAGAVLDGDVLRTSGGRVLGVSAAAPTLAEAVEKAYADADRIEFKNKYMRRDIGKRALQAK